MPVRIFLKKMKIKLQDRKECYKCHTTLDLHRHEIFYGTANRKKSIQYGCQVWLCGKHHNLSSEGVHFDRTFDLELKMAAQTEFERLNGHEMYMKVFGRNYL